MAGLLANDVEDVVDVDSAEQLAVVVDDGRGNEVVVLEQGCDLCRFHVGVDRRDLGIHDVGDGLVGLTRQQLCQEQAAEVVTLTADDEQRIHADR